MPAHRSDRDYIDRTIETVRVHQGNKDNCWPQWANIFADEIEGLRADLHEQRMDMLKMRAATRELIVRAESVNENVMGNGLAYRRDHLRTAIGDAFTTLDRLAKRRCPACGEQTTEEDEEIHCEYCGWDDRTRCSHGIPEDEFCQHCPGGGV